MREADLARPVVEIKDFLTNSIEYEIYTFSDQVIVVPTKPKEQNTYSERRPMQRPFDRRRGPNPRFNRDEMIAGVAEGYRIPAQVRFTSNRITITVEPVFSNKNLKIYADGKLLFSSETDGEGSINIRKDVPTGEKLLRALRDNANIYATL
jgi:predicted PilT family ATPase